MARSNTDWEEYRRAFRVSLQWYASWKTTGDQRHRLAAQVCHHMAREWLNVAHGEHQISVARFRRERSRLNNPPPDDLAELIREYA